MVMQPAPNLWFKADEIYATIERDDDMPFGWFVQVWTSPITSTRKYAFTQAGARRAARRGIALHRRRLTRLTDREVIR